MTQNALFNRIAHSSQAIGAAGSPTIEGRVAAARGLVLDIAGTSNHVSLGDWVTLHRPAGMDDTLAEIIAFDGGLAKAMPFGWLDGLGPGSAATAMLTVQGRSSYAGGPTGRRPLSRPGTFAVCDSWLGRVLDALGNPLDGRGPLPSGPAATPVRRSAPDATKRARLGARLDLGVCALNTFATCLQGQRLGLFAGSGVGKSTLLATLAEQTACDVTVLALIGERGREVREFLEETLGPSGLSRSIVVVATSDAAPLMRRQAAYSAMAIAEHFRDQGRSVLLLMDSITRFCLALREIGLSAGEPPATRGYPPSVFAELPAMVERAGPGIESKSGSQGYITGFFSVLVEGDDLNEPVSDAVRSLLDGHVILDRRIAESGRFPPIDVLRSLSRTVPGCQSAAEQAAIRRARSILALSADVSDLVRLGAYRPGHDPNADEAISLAPGIESALQQERGERVDFAQSFARLESALNGSAAV